MQVFPPHILESIATLLARTYSNVFCSSHGKVNHIGQVRYKLYVKFACVEGIRHIQLWF